MNVIVIGCGKVGSRFAQVLVEEGHDVVIVDNDRESFKALDPAFNGVVVTGVPIDQDVLKKAGIETADALAALTPDDNVNIMVCQVAKEIFKVPNVIARIYNPNREHIFNQFGLNTICPTNITVEVIRSMMLGNQGQSTHTIGNYSFDFRHEKLPKNLEGKKLLTVNLGEDSTIFGIIHNDKFVFAYPNYKLTKGDILVISDLSTKERG